MLGSSDLIALVGAGDLARARSFYEEVLGLTLVDAGTLACVFQVSGAMLRVTEVAEVVPAPYTVLGWGVEDIAATVRGLAERGVAFKRFDRMDQDELGVWRSPSGARVAWFADLDGNTLSLTQF